MQLRGGFPAGTGDQDPGAFGQARCETRSRCFERDGERIRMLGLARLFFPLTAMLDSAAVPLAGRQPKLVVEQPFASPGD
jgi:hypothetical protein